LPAGFSGLQRTVVGDFRGNTPIQFISGPVGREKIHYEAPPGNRVEKELKLFLEWWQRDKFKLDLGGILRAVIEGFWFVSIHRYAP
jgi:Fic family protein